MAVTIDYTTIREGGPGPDPSAAPLRWWLEKGDQAAAGVTSTLLRLHEQQTMRLTQLLIAGRLYGNISLLGLQGTATRYRAVAPILRERIIFNAFQSGVDTITSRVAKNKPKPLFLTSGGDYRQQRKAKGLNKFIEGVFYENDAYRLGVEAFRDGAVMGDGIIHVYPNNGRVKFERVLPNELWVDELEAICGVPRQMHRVKGVDRQVLLELAEKWLTDSGADEKRIKEVLYKIGIADRYMKEIRPQYDISDLVEVRESWHLPEGPDATKDDPKGGVHKITASNVEIFSEPYTKPFFPFARFRWCPRMTGYWSQGGAEQTQNLQIELNRLLNTVHRTLHLGGTFRVFLERGSKIVKAHISNEIGSMVEYTGTPPTIAAPQLVQPELLQECISVKDLIYDQLGVSQLAATSQKPEGLNSGRALREYNDIGTDRFMTIGQEYERFFLELARLSVECVRDLTNNGRRSYVVRSPQRGKSIVVLDAKNLMLPDNDFVLQMFPISSLPNEPAGRQQTVQEWVQAGWVTPRTGKRLMDFPDLEMAESLSSAAEDWIQQMLDGILDDGKPAQPDPYDDLALAREMALEYYQLGKVQSLEPERQELLRQFIDNVTYLQTQAMAQAAPGGALGAPQAPPVQPQPSELVPNAPGMAA